jgi:hypothetical protein
MSNYSPSIYSISTPSGNYFLSLRFVIDSLATREFFFAYYYISTTYSGLIGEMRA